MLGVDIGNSGVRVMELALHGRQLQIAHYAHCRLPPGAIRDGSVVMREEVAESLHGVTDYRFRAEQDAATQRKR